MDAYFTRISLPKFPFKIGSDDTILSIGSCFASHLGAYFHSHKFRTLVNPVGLLFNPLSICNSLRMIMEHQSLAEFPQLVVQQDGLWHSLYHHGIFSHEERQELVDKVDAATMATNRFLSQTDYVIITLGSAHLYRHKATQAVVANCHKLNSSEFVKELCTPKQVVQEMQDIFAKMHAINNDLQIILTVSPVRYIRDGLVENNQSKSVLIMATHELVEQLDFCHYFPAYELLLDQLRDYRFYDLDMVHPNRQAINFILERFVETHFNQDAKTKVNKIDALLQSLAHRPHHPNSVGYRKFLNELAAQIRTLKSEYPGVDFGEEERKINHS